MNSYSGLVDENFSRFLSEMTRESARGCAIVGSAQLDDLISQVITQYLIENTEKKNIMGEYGLLSSFHSRITIAYAVGLISKSDKEALIHIKNIRNRFAHDISISFDDELNHVKGLYQTAETNEKENSINNNSIVNLIFILFFILQSPSIHFQNTYLCYLYYL